MKQFKLSITAGIILSTLTACGGSNGSGNNDTSNGNSDFDTSFPKKVNVFGIGIRGSANTSEDVLLHAANVMAEYLDNDEDGEPDNEDIVSQLVASGATLIMAADQAEMEPLYDTVPDSNAFQDLYAEEVFPNGSEEGEFDATLEEVLHLITHVGYAQVYPDVFGEAPDTTLTDAMDIARGGRFTSIPSSYPAGAWYTYDDTTCDYSCMATEYLYWALTSILGAQEFAGRLEQIQHEWTLNTADKVITQDPAIYALLSNEEYRLPTLLPEGDYEAAEFVVEQVSSQQTGVDSNNE